MSIPIAVPPGPSGLAPTLSLNYSSEQGDGPFGLGWNLQLGEIRCTARFGVPDYANCPEFELDGQLLVGPDIRPGMEGRYHTQVESFEKIALQGSGASAYWEVTSPGGMRRLYGVTTDSKVKSNGLDSPPTAPTARWLLSKIVDLHGNEILIHYDRTGVGVAYPLTVSYASGEREVKFLYESRPDEILDFPGGIPRIITQRLREIEIKSLGTIFSRRLITYSTPGDYSTQRSRIVSTQLFGKDCDDPDPVANCPSLPAQTYEYTETMVNGGNPYWEMAPTGDWEEAGILVKTGLQTDSTDLGKRLADVNGDGLPDLVVGYCIDVTAPCEDPGEGPVVYINGGSGWVEDAAWTAAIDSLTYEAPTITVESVAYPPYYTRACNVTTGTVTRRISFGTEEADWEPIVTNGNFETFTPWPSWHLIDVNGDGFADLVTSTRGGAVPLDFDCAGNPIVPGDNWYDIVFGGELSQVIFLNNGAGWDPAPAGMAESLPVFQTQTIVKNMYDVESSVGGSSANCDGSGWLGGWVGLTSYCTMFMDLRPQFVELNGDGLLDIIILVPYRGEEDGVLWLDDFNDSPGWWIGESKSVAWIQDADGSGWTPAPNFDLPFPHLRYNWIEDRGYDPIHGAGGMQPYDAGVYFVDLNRDGLTDIVKDDYGYLSGGSPAAVILGTGTGWCNDLGTSVTSDCDADTSHSRYAPPIAFNEYTTDTRGEDISKSEQLVFVDVNGDGWVDLLQGKDGILGNPDVLKAWLHDPSAPAVDSAGKPSVWVDRSAEFKPPTPFYAGTQFEDLDGNGTADILQGWRLYFGSDEFVANDAYLSPGTYSDLLASVDNGRGGSTAFTYVSAVVQRDDAMESDAEAHAATLGDADGISVAVTRFTPKPVVAEQALSGVGIAANVNTHYQYGRPRFDPIERSDLGFGLTETTNPDNSRVDSYYYQREGLVGRLSSQRTFDENDNQVHTSDQTWVLAPDPGSIPGATAGVHVARVSSQSSSNVYGTNVLGPVNTTDFSYDDSYGFNFVSQSVNTRATNTLTTIYAPDAEVYDEGQWLVGLVGEKTQTDAGITYSHETYDYTGDGQIEYRNRDIQPRSGGTLDVATTLWAYDSWGNVIRQTDTRGGGESDRVVEFCYDGDGGGSSWCPAIPSGTPATHSLRVGLKDAIGGVAELEYDWVTGAVLHVERFNESNVFRDAMTVVRDGFGRSKEQWFKGASVNGGGLGVQLTATAYHDAPIGTTPAYVEQFQFTGKVGEAPIRSARYLDGFGNAFRAVEKTPSGYRGTAVFRDPVARVIRSVGPIDCDLDASCSNITETTEPATEQLMDAVSRAVQLTSPDGQATQQYSWTRRVQPAGSGAGSVFDTVAITDSNGNTTRRLMDGNLIVWVDECQDSGCASLDSTFYTYESTGELSTIYDAIATSTGDYTSPARYLRYHHDTLGRVVQTDEPNTGSSSAEYDHQGNNTSTTNVRDATTLTHYDALGRVLSIDRPAGVGEWDLDFTYDPISRERKTVTSPDSAYSDAWEYDDFGQVKRQERTYTDTMVMDFEYDLLGRPTKISYPSVDSSATYVYQGAYLDQVCRGADFCVSAPQDLLISQVQYDDLGRRADTVTPEGTLHREYYGLGDAGNGRSINGLKRLAITAGNAAGALDFNYQYDSMGNITHIGDASTTYDATATYTYDARNRLESWTDAGNETEWYSYDALGNLVGYGVESHGGTNQTFDPANYPHRVTQNRVGDVYAYDADGNVIQRGGQFYVYDSANRMVCTGTSLNSCNGPGYRYDAGGQLLWDGATGEQLMGELFKWQSSDSTAVSNIVAFGEVIAEVKQTNSQLRTLHAPVGWRLPIQKGPLQWMLAGAGVLALVGLLAWLGVGPAFSQSPATVALALALTTLLAVPLPAWGRKGRGGGGNPPPPPGTVTTVRTSFRDHLGSTAYVPELNERHAYEPFGSELLTGGIQRDNFTGKEYHGGSDMYYFGARWYDSRAGRFASLDPLVANPGDPQSLNAYSYVRNDPVNLIDPSGMEYMETITITGTRGSSSYTSISTGSLSMGISAPRFSIASVGAGLYIAVDGHLTGTQNSQEQGECCGSDPSEGGDSAGVGAEGGAHSLRTEKLIEELGDVIETLNRLIEEAEKEIGDNQVKIDDYQRNIDYLEDKIMSNDLDQVLMNGLVAAATKGKESYIDSQRGSQQQFAKERDALIATNRTLSFRITGWKGQKERLSLRKEKLASRE